VESGSPADGATVAELFPGDAARPALASRGGRRLSLRASTRLRAGDVVLTDIDEGHDVTDLFVRQD
jgi:hypothetical protein